MSAYYNENDKQAAAWLRELIKAGLIAPGDVDERSIKDVSPDDVAGYDQCHFFAGIGGWSYALRLGGIPDDFPIWTGSCPCQPFSSAGKRKGQKDSRHLWPWFRHLIFRCRPSIATGEQVASADGRAWLSGVRANLETLGYAVGAADLCAAGVGANHVRQRLYWCARSNANSMRPQGQRQSPPWSWSCEQFAGLVQASLRDSVPTGKSGLLSDGIPARVVRLRGYGNAIVPQCAAEFVKACLTEA